MKKILTQVLLVLLMVFLGAGSGLALDVVAEEEFSYSQVTTLKVSGGFCDVEVIGKEQSGVDFKGKIAKSGFRLGSDYQIKYQNKDGVVTVWIAGDEGSFGLGELKGKLKFHVPNKLPVKIKTSSGDIKLKQITGEQKLTATSGDVRVINCNGQLEVETTSGDQIYKEVTGNLNLDSSSGDVEVVNLKGNIKGDSSSGEHNYSNITGNCEVETSSGNLELMDINGQLQLETTSGDIEGKRILLTDDAYLNTTSGDITLDLKNKLKELSFDLESTSGRLRAGTTTGKERLMIHRGTIMIKGESTSGDQKYY